MNLNKWSMRFRQTKPTFADLAAQRRAEISESVYDFCEGRVLHGPFQGMRISKGTRPGWDLVGSLFGWYEKEVQEIAKHALTHQQGSFLNLGAGEGFYAVGVLFSGLATNAWAFESDLSKRLAIEKNAQLNNLRPERLTVLGHADLDALLSVPDSHLVSLVLVDIEGGEYSLLVEEVFSHFSHATFIVELHPWQSKNGEEEKLVRRARKAGLVSTKINQSSRNPNQEDSLAAFSDDDRWILCSEGRPERMSWLIFARPELLKAFSETME